MRIRFATIAFLAALLSLAIAPGHAQTISTFAGASKCCDSTDGLPATNAWLASVTGLTADKQGNLYIWQGGAFKVRKVDSKGIISTFAGNGTFGYTGDGGPATSARLFSSTVLTGLAADSAGNIYITDSQNNAIRKVDTAGIITTVAGNGSPGFSGDGGPATSAQLNSPNGIVVDAAGNLYISDYNNDRVRKVNTAGIISTYAGTGNSRYVGDGGPATAATVSGPTGLAIDSAGNLFISETSSSRVRKVDPSGIIALYAGQFPEANGFSGDGGPATAAKLYGPIGLAVDKAGNLYIADNINNRVRKVSAAGIITTYAGNGGGTASTPLGDGGLATNAYIGVGKDVAVDEAGNVYIGGNAGGIARVRKVAPAAAGISTSPSTLSFAFTMGGAAPPSQNVSVTNSGAAASFTAVASTTSGSNWLSVTPGAGATPATLSVSVNPAGLPGGVYQGAITLTPSGGAAQTFAVTLTVTGAGAPVFSSGSVYNALGYQAKLAPGAMFVIFGTRLGPASLAAATGPNYPLAVGGTSVTLTPAAGGAAISAKMVYAAEGQIAALLPSSIAPGAYAVRVTYNTLPSAPQNVTVVARSFGIATVNSAGTGTAQATIGNLNGGVSLTRFTSGKVSFNGLDWVLSPAHPGDTLVLWGTGGGSDLANDSGGTSGDQTKAGNFSVLVGGRQVTPLYAGASSGYAGLWQINFTLPTDIMPDCFAIVQVSAGGELSNAVSVPIAANGQDICASSQLSKEDLTRLDAGGTIVMGGFAISKVAVTSTFVLAGASSPTVTTVGAESASGGLSVYTAAQYAAIDAGLKIGACTVTDRTASSNTKSPSAPEGYLDVGSTIPIGGPGVAAGAALAVASSNPGPVYYVQFNNGALVGGSRYTLTGRGGKDVGAFSAGVNFPPAFTVANWDSLNLIDRGKPLTVNWTGGIDSVFIIGSTSSVVGKDATNTNIVHTVTFSCEVPAAPGSYTVPTAVLGYLLPEGITAAALANGSGMLAVQTATTQPFDAPLTAGGKATFASFSAIQAYSRTVAVQ